ncbi:MAG: molybdopterin-guanine dinucleotide biosynthesis protein MobB [Candidatus Omnitrophica bacterium]|nr:molybdopterin-guanine dinucleotide biosynthesis protein MobB [Candidatus Omnitrophota bacterium]
MSHRSSALNQSFFFHPFEVAFYGAAGKTVLIERLLQRLSKRYKIGYFIQQKEDARARDIEQLRQSGAWMVFVNDPRGNILIYTDSSSELMHPPSILESNFFLLEGYSGRDVPTIVVLDEHVDILDNPGGFQRGNVIAYIGDLKGNIPTGKPHFRHEDTDGIERHVLSFFESRVKEIPLYGLVLAGGRSTRMNKDKSLLEYHGKSQAAYCFDLLSGYCDQVYVSSRAGQSYLSGHKILPQLHDTFLDIGPLGGILTAATKFPEAAWLVLACDLPFVDSRVIEKLVHNRNPFKMATAYRSARKNGQPEPLCVIYEPKARFRLLEFLGAGTDCPRRILSHSDVHLLELDAEFLLDNVNDPAECQKVIALLNKGPRSY